MINLNGKVALVTGAASGIGRAVAIEFARCGASVLAADIDLKGVQNTQRIIRQQGGNAQAMQVDVTQACDAKNMVNTAIQEFGRLDYACNNAGITGEVTSIADCSEENWDNVISVNLKGVWLCMKYQLKHMIEEKSGAIVNMSSVAGLVGINDQIAPYSPSKFGVIGLTKTAALENAKLGIRINAVCPGEINTPMQDGFSATPEQFAEAIKNEPIGRFGEPEEIANTVIWLCSDQASFVTGHAMAVDGGYVAQ